MAAKKPNARIPEDKTGKPTFGDKTRATLSYVIIGAALLYVLIIAIGYITGWRTELESTAHLAAVGAFFSGTFGVILGYYFGRMGAGAAKATADAATKELNQIKGKTGELIRCVAQLQEIAQPKAKTDERIRTIVKYGDNAIQAVKELQ